MATQTIAGVDIGTTAIRAVETMMVRGRPVLSGFAHAPLAPGMIVGGVVMDQDGVAAALKTLWAAAKFRTRDVVIGITHHQTIVREVSLPALDRRELEMALPFQIVDVLPFPVDKAVIDFHPFDDQADSGVRRGLLVAAPRDPVLQLVRTVEKARLRVTRVDLGILAVLRAAARPGPEAHALVDLGAHASSVVVHVGGRPRIVRTLPRGGDDLTALLASRMQLSLTAAEDLKRIVGLVPELDQRAASMMRDAVRPLLTELRGSLAYLSGNADEDVEVGRVDLCGGAALLPGLLELLNAELGIPVGLADPMTRFSGHRRPENFDDLARNRTLSAAAVGLTLVSAA